MYTCNYNGDTCIITLITNPIIVLICLPSLLLYDFSFPVPHVTERLVKRLLPLGFTRTAILKELNKGGEDVNVVALELLEEERKALEEKDQTKQKLKLKSLEVIICSILTLYTYM